IEDFGITVTAKHDVFGLDVAMNDSGFVGGYQRARDLSGHFERFAQLHRRALYPLAQRLPVNEFGDNEISALCLPDFENGDDVRMVECRGSARFALKPLHTLAVLCELVWKQLDCDTTPQSGVLGQVNLTHPACAEQGIDLIISDRPSLHCLRLF